MPVGKYVALATELEKDIHSGKYGQEGGLPSVIELAEKWGAAINTVKSSLALLEGKGIIEKRGSNYYVNKIDIVMTRHVPAATARLPRGSFCRNISDVTVDAFPSYLVVKIDASSPGQAPHRTQVSGEFVDGKERPIMVASRYYLLALTPEQVNRLEDATYDPMWDESDVPVSLVAHNISCARLATEEERTLLHLPNPSAVTNLFEAIYDAQGNVLMAQEVVVSPAYDLHHRYPFMNRP